MSLRGQLRLSLTLALLSLPALLGPATAQAATVPAPVCGGSVPAAVPSAQPYTTQTLPNNPFVPAERAPDQWLAKLFTETLGCAPGQASYAADDAWIQGQGCGLGSLRELATSFLTSPQFLRRRYDNAERLLVLWRVARQSEPSARRFARLLAALDSGAESWSAVVRSLFRAPGFAPFVAALCTDQLYGWNAQTPVIDLPLRPGAGFSGGTGQQLQALLNAAKPGDTVWLARSAVVRVSGQVTIPAGVTLETVGAPSPRDYAAMARLVRTSAFPAPVVALSSGATLANVWVDGQRSNQNVGMNHDAIDVAVLGGIGTTVRQDRIDNTAGWSNMVVYNQATSSIPPCQNVQVDSNLIDGYPTKFHWYETAGLVDGRVDTGTLTGQLTNFENGQTGVSSTFGFADGISNQCWDSHIVANQIIDATDVSIVLFGAAASTETSVAGHQHSVVTGNTIVNAGNSGWSAMTVDPLYQIGTAKYDDFDGTSISHNLIWTSPDAFLLIGTGIGTKPWFGSNTAFGFGKVSYLDNTSGTGVINTQTAIAVTRMGGAVVQGNSLRANLEWGDLCPKNDYIIVDESAGSSVQQPSTSTSFPSFPIPSEDEGCLNLHL